MREYTRIITIKVIAGVMANNQDEAVAKLDAATFLSAVRPPSQVGDVTLSLHGRISAKVEPSTSKQASHKALIEDLSNLIRELEDDDADFSDNTLQ